MSRLVNTVTGPVSSDQLGGILAHEHILFGYPGYQGDATFEAWDEDRFFEGMMPIIKKIKKQGIKTIMDATPNDLGRDVEKLKSFSEHFSMNVICSTGYYYEHGGAPAYWNFRKNFGCPVEEEVYELMKTEFSKGVKDTGIKCGLVKVGSGVNSISEYEQIMFRAACRLAKEDPDVRIITHCSHGTMLKAQAEFFLEQGVNPRQVQLGHFCDTRDINDQIYCLENGFYAGFDRMGQINFDGMPDDELRIDHIVQLVKAGFGKQINMSHDRLYWTFGRKFICAEEIAAPKEVVEALLKEWHWTYVIEKVLPRLQSMGLTEEQTHCLMFENPQNFMGGD